MICLFNFRELPRSGYSKSRCVSSCSVDSMSDVIGDMRGNFYIKIEL